MNSVGAKQIKSGAIDNSKIRSGSLRASAFKKGQLKAGPRGKQGLVGTLGPVGPAGLGIKLAADTHYVAVDIPGDSQWHDWAVLKFNAAANTIYTPNYDSDYTGYGTTGATCATGLGQMSRVAINGAVITKVDANGFSSYTPQFYGPYPAGTSGHDSVPVLLGLRDPVVPCPWRRSDPDAVPDAVTP